MKIASINCLTLCSSLVFVGGASSAAVITPAIESVIDPSGLQDVDVEGIAAGSATTSLDGFNSLPGLMVIQDFTGFADGVTNIVDNADGTPDLQFSVAGSDKSNVNGDDTSPIANTSPGSAVLTVGGGGTTVTTRIDFGTYDGVTGFANDLGVLAAGLTVNDVNSIISVTVNFLDSNDQVIASSGPIVGVNSSDGADNGHTDIFFGYDGGIEGTPIYAVEVVRENTSFGLAGPNSAIDDVAFVVPEPGSLSLLALGIIIPWRKRR